MDYIEKLASRLAKEDAGKLQAEILNFLRKNPPRYTVKKTSESSLELSFDVEKHLRDSLDK
jgi:hypothetical protein